MPPIGAKAGEVAQDQPDRILNLGFELARTCGGSFQAAKADLGSVDVDEFGLQTGARKSYIPDLGERVWELPEPKRMQSPYWAFLNRLEDGAHVGYLRIPHFEFNSRHVSVFGEIVSALEGSSDAMVLDLSRNPGGNLFQMYALLSFLATEPIEVPRHFVNFQDVDIREAEQNVALAALSIDDDDRPSAEVIDYSRTILAEVASGRQHNSAPLWLGGIKEVRPAKIHYSRRIVAVIDCLSFSAAEFMAAMLQDSKRAVLFGEKTAGAGGCAREALPLMTKSDRTSSELLGVKSATFRWTLGLRANGGMIQDVGVSPDFPYCLTVEDLTDDYHGMRAALIAALAATMPPGT